MPSPIAAIISIPTPEYKLDEADEEGGVYPPAEDTFLMMDALESDQQASPHSLSFPA